MIKLVSYRSQVVAGTNYFAKAQVGQNEYIHLRFFKPLPVVKNSLPRFSGVLLDMSLEDTLRYF
jgi:hypothetical protein